MRTIGIVGLGKLGLPVALAIESQGYRVIGVDPDPRVEQTLRTRRLPYLERGAPDLLLRSEIRLVDMAELVDEADLVFVAVQTPHSPVFEGITPLPDERDDFDYSYLRGAVAQLANLATARRGQWREVKADGKVIDRLWDGRPLPVAIISTCLPGTFKREIAPLLDGGVDIAYNPFFIAMGTTIQDFLEPEFVLVGYHEDRRWGVVARKLFGFYARLHKAPLLEMDVTSAELTKVAYNAFLGQKIVMANAVMELAHKVGADCDMVTDALSQATERIVSSAYMRGGMGDGGGCHPRDNIALSWLAREKNLSFDVFDSMMRAREAQTAWLVDLVGCYDHQLPVVVLGKAYKPGTNLTTGSPAVLLHGMLAEHRKDVIAYDPMVDDGPPPLDRPAVFVVATQHPEFACYRYPAGSIVIDPFRYVEDKDDVRVVRIGHRSQA